MPMSDKVLPERFWAKVQKLSGCWVWTASLDRYGYGHFGMDGRHYRAHRLVWTSMNGDPPVGMHVCHKCDNRRCVRPDHLFLGTNRDNFRDASRKGRIANQRKTHCPQGHEYTPENTMLAKNPRCLAGVQRRCRTCWREKQRVYERGRVRVRRRR